MHRISDSVFCRLVQMSVDVGGRGDGGVTEPHLHFFQACVVCDEHGRAGMAQVVETNLFHAEPFEQYRETFGNAVGMNEIAHRIDADHVEILAVIVPPEHLAVGFLLFFLLQQNFPDISNQRERTAGGFIFHIFADDQFGFAVFGQFNDFL